ncbi:MAG: homoserine dehydrogenase, partial [Oceanococcaceae bacterium]
MSAAPLRLGLLGLGTVGAGTVRVLQDNAESISRRAGRRLVVTAAAVRDVGQARDCPMDGIRLETDPMAVATAADVDVVVELIGGTTLARTVVLAALTAGKPVVTANKALIAEHGAEIFACARANDQPVAFEAAVAGGIPIIKALREGLAGNAITEINGLINGTTNFILSKMQSEKAAFAPVLAEAQQMGYAEADPTFDVEGIDAAHKLAILAMLAFDLPLATDGIRTRGVGLVSAADLEAAAGLGYRIKHLAVARQSADGVELRVEPTLLPETSYLAKIDGVMNGVIVVGSAVGSAGFYGPGAGALATASAVVADLIDVAQGRVLP